MNRIGRGTKEGSRTKCARRSIQHGEAGFSILEALVSILILSAFTAGLVDSLAQTEWFSCSSQNEVLAATMAQQIIDSTRNLDFATMSGLNKAVPYTLLVNKTTTGQSGPTFMPQALLIDSTSESWSSAAQKNIFGGTVTEQFDNGPATGTLTVTVTCSWTENDGPKIFQMKTLVAANGIHN